MPPGPPVLPGTRRNIERTGERHVTRLSSVARRVENVRGIDVDYVQYCPRCRSPQVFCEVKSRDVHDREWEQVRIFARHWGNGCIALLVIEPPQQYLGYRAYYSSTDLFMAHPVYGSEDDLQRKLEHARDIHECQLR